MNATKLPRRILERAYRAANKQLSANADRYLVSYITAHDGEQCAHVVAYTQEVERRVTIRRMKVDRELSHRDYHNIKF